MTTNSGSALLCGNHTKSMKRSTPTPNQRHTLALGLCTALGLFGSTLAVRATDLVNDTWIDGNRTQPAAPTIMIPKFGKRPVMNRTSLQKEKRTKILYMLPNRSYSDDLVARTRYGFNPEV